MKRVVILGAGGHGREVAEILLYLSQTNSECELLGFVDDDPRLDGRSVDGVPVLGGLSWFNGADPSDIQVVCAVGRPEVCRQVVKRALNMGLAFTNVISPLAYISPSAHVGDGITVFPHVFVSRNCRVESYCALNAGVTVSHDTRIGKYCNINPGAHIAGNVTVNEGCYIGMGANVIPGSEIGAWTVLGAGAAVVGDLPANVTAVGVPARVIKTRSEGWHER